LIERPKTGGLIYSPIPGLGNQLTRHAKGTYSRRRNSRPARIDLAPPSRPAAKMMRALRQLKETVAVTASASGVDADDKK
jgi:hypothetical protein